MRVAAGDLDGVAGVEIVVACEDMVVALDRRGKVVARFAARGWPQVLAVADLDGDKRAEVYAGFGRSRRRGQAKAQLWRLRLRGAAFESNLVLQPETTRAELTALVPRPRERALLLAYYESKYQVRHVRLRAKASGGGFDSELLGTFRMATSVAAFRPRRGAEVLHVVGRIYGDARGTPGDAFVLRGAKRDAIPTVRGVRALAVAHLDGPSAEPTLLLADGWARNYGRDARALLAAVRVRGPGAHVREPLFALSGEFAIFRMRPVDIENDGRDELIVIGSSTVRVLAFSARDRAGRRQVTARVVGQRQDDATAADLDGDGRAEVIVVGSAPAIVSLPRRQGER
ncbi:MAG: VCBS repeat-containing protein [Myxococcales bacterium]|nr:VCBS repeat-containing protein [Myxococcales bacterium]